MTQFDLHTINDLFSWRRLPHAKNSETSKAGAIDAAKRAKTQCDAILAHLRSMGSYGANSWELRQATKIDRTSTMSARLNELEEKCLIRKVEGKKRLSECKILTQVYVAI